MVKEMLEQTERLQKDMAKLQDKCGSETYLFKFTLCVFVRQNIHYWGHDHINSLQHFECTLRAKSHNQVFIILVFKHYANHLTT